MTATAATILNLQRFAAANKDFSVYLHKFNLENLSSADLHTIYLEISQYLLKLEWTEKVVECFRKDFLSILSLAIDFEHELNLNNGCNGQNAVVLAKLISLHPDAKSFVLKYFEKFPGLFDVPNEKSTSPKQRKQSKTTNPPTDLEIVTCCHTLLSYKPDFFKAKWRWSDFFSKFGDHSDPMVKFMCAQCIGIYTGMNEAKLQDYLANVLVRDDVISCSIKFKQQVLHDAEVVELDNLGDTETVSIGGVICVNGIYLPVYGSALKGSSMVEVDSTKRNLQKLALGIATGKAINLLGPVGSGKTSLVEYLAEKTGRVLGESFIKIQLGDQTDSKMLLGTYRCTDVPGEFVWQAGVLTQAVMDGSWLLLEDIDSASMDIACVLSGLIENGYLTVPGYRDCVPIAPGFQLFLTQRLITTITGHHRRHTNTNTLLEKHVLSVNIEPLTYDELSEIITTLHTPLKTICSRMVNVFQLFSKDTDKIPRSGRLISTRDLFKWCSRAVIDFDVSSQSSALKVLQDAIDIFCCSYSNLEDRLNLAKEISTHLGIINEKARYFCQQYKPQLSLTDNSLQAGRASIHRSHIYTNKIIKFCFTRPSAVLLERVMCCISLNEPVLLVGETGTGKTSSIQYLAHTLGQKLIVINMNQQSDSADLLGGYKPVDLKLIMAPIKSEFETLFKSYFNADANKKFLSNLNYCLNERQFGNLVKLMKRSYEAAMNRLSKTKVGEKRAATPEKSRKELRFLNLWTEMGVKLEKLEQQIKHKNALAFAFIEGSLVRAIEAGHWVLLDEINLANAETLECLSGLLEGSKGTLSLLERGDKKPVVRHPKFTLFSCMNPSTDVGKKDLPVGLRNRFTELFVDELTDRVDLLLMSSSYLEAMALPPERLESIVKFYLGVRKEATSSLSDGLGHKPHFSLRSLCRALAIAAKNPCGTFNRSLYEAFCLSFLTQLDADSYKTVEGMIAKYMLGGAKEIKSVLKQPIMEPKLPEKHLQFEGYWILKGQLEPVVVEDYILTESVRRNLKDLVRVVSIGRLPVLLQGDTSVGKTSLITYLAKASGYKCVRINNHEHTDLQEYIGCYMASEDGKLQFREGLLVQAMRKGHWIILDELNLAPTDVLEALNRVLDDNRELFIPETQETVKAHPNFMLFATQNPPGAYGGRKMLSRAFRNRFVELHFNEIPHTELEFILHKRCQMAPSYAKKMINVMKDLQMRRKGSAAFAGKHGFITLRDLFRWGERYRQAQNVSELYDWDQHLADEGYLLLAGRVRKNQEREEIAQALQKHMKREVVPENLFTLCDKTSPVTKPILEKILSLQSAHKNIVWTYNMRQLAVLVSKSLQFSEPVLLVGETGGGKTTVCNLIAESNGHKLVTINCHMHTESSDFLGGLRPVRDHTEENLNKLFEWVDGPLVQAMVQGNLFLADEISLADDSVLERLNSLLEPERSLLLAEKGSDTNNDNSELIVAHKSFHFIGTMNPGGDFGKKELSPALRNRFTEIWCETCSNRQDLTEIIEHNLIQIVRQTGVGNNIMDFIEWFKMQEMGKRFTISIRDILTWVDFINKSSATVGASSSYLHGACLTFLDSLGSGVTSMENPIILEKFRSECTNFIKNQLKQDLPDLTKIEAVVVEKVDNQFGIKPFYIEICEEGEKHEFSFNAPTTAYNALRLLRGLQLQKAILLEGSPGVGKTSLVTALAKATGNKIFRINLSDQTDISDLFGADLPVEGGQAGQFSWKDGPLLQALKKGHWILLDELNLASQSVLEGLNACLDHRGEIFIPELGKTFYVKSGTRFFGCQNPLKQGGSRRGLPQSFLNRFTQVYLTSLRDKDLYHILSTQFPKLPSTMLQKMIDFNTALNTELDKHVFGHKGAPWEFNLRDLTRWCEATLYHQANADRGFHPENLVQLIFVDRMRTEGDKRKVEEVFEGVFGVAMGGTAPVGYVKKTEVYLGDVTLSRDVDGCNESVLKQDTGCLLLRNQLKSLRSLAYCINLNWMSILVGTGECGKSSMVRTLAKLTGKTLKTLSVTSAMDTTDILGGFEQADFTRHLEELSKQTERILLTTSQNLFTSNNAPDGIQLLRVWEDYTHKLYTDDNIGRTMTQETKVFLLKLDNLKSIWNELSKHVDVKHLVKRGETIAEIVREEDSLNAGGKFEWVDSVLVKCLQEGFWLLVDNVNLCSPAVLDRLNALLEPNGVLTIGERGVDKDGKMIDIKPHPEFRLFLTMDPKNGDISRAMRNRGVEIYILNSDESGCRNQIDIKAMIHEQGLENSAQINALIKVHDLIAELTLGEKPNIGHLLQAAFLIAQHTSRGTRVLHAFTVVILDIYFSTKSCSEFNTPDAKTIITDEIQQALTNSDELYHSALTLSTKNIERDTQLAHIAQQMTPFKESASDLLAQFNFIHFFTMTTQEDLAMRLVYIKTQLQADENYTALAETFYENLLTKLQTNPLDWRWLPETTTTQTNPNSTFIQLYYLSQLQLKESPALTNRKKSKLFTLHNYLTAIKKREVETKIDDPVLQNILTLLSHYDTFILSQQTDFSDDEAIKLISHLQYRFALHDYLQMQITGIKQITEDVLNNLHVYYKWFIKFAVRRLRCGDAHLLKLMYATNLSLTNHFSVLKKIGKRYRGAIDVPPPLINQVQLDTVNGLHDLVSEYDVYNKRNRFEDVVGRLVAGGEILERVLKLKVGFNYETDVVSEDYNDIQLLERSVMPPKRCDVAILPIFDYFSLMNVMKYRCGFNRDIGLHCGTVPLHLQGVIAKYKDVKDSRLLHELVTELEWYIRNSCALSPNKFINFHIETDVEIKGVALHTPVLTYLVSNLLIDVRNEDAIVGTTLGGYRDSMVMHKKIQSVLWRNIQQISDSSYDFISSERNYLLNRYNEFLIALATGLDVPLDKVHPELLQACIDKIELLYNEQHFPERDCIMYLTKVLCNELKDLSDNYQDDVMLNTISNVYILLSYIKALLTSRLPLIDPLSKVTMKKKQCIEEKNMFVILKESFVMQNDVLSGNTKCLHPYCGLIDEKVKELEEKNTELGKYVAVRPPTVEYQTISKMISHGFATILSTGKIRQIYTEMNDTMKELLNAIDGSTEYNMKLPNAALRVTVSTVNCLDSFANNLKVHRHNYPDIIEPLLSDIMEMAHGVHLKAGLFRKQILRYKHTQARYSLDEDLLNFIKLPVMDENRTDYRDVIGHYVNWKIHGFFADALVEAESEEITNSKRNIFGLLKCGILEISNLCQLDARYAVKINKELFSDFNNIIQHFVGMWMKQEEEAKVKIAEGESLYKIKTKCDDKTEDELAQEEFDKLFPSYHEQDFNDMQKDKLLDDEPMEVEDTEFSELIRQEDIDFVAKIHSDFMKYHTKTEWLNPTTTPESYKCDLLTPILCKAKLYKMLLNKSVDCLSYRMDGEAVGSLVVLAAIAKQFGDTSFLDESDMGRSAQKYNFYKDSNVDEVKSCYHILEELRMKIDEFLSEWPEHPTLKTIRTIIERIYNFDITSPIPRFLTGFDILLTKCHEWEENAHSGVSLVPHSLEISQQMLTWRKLEMNNWKHALDNSLDKMQQGATKYWFNIYNIMFDFIHKKAFDATELISTLQKFILQSNVAEFEARINLLYVFHCHATHLQVGANRDDFISILWNMYKHYEQFVPNVTSRMRTQRTPIEKKLKDYVKIVRWKDISYWALKETLASTHKIIHKYMREYEEVLKQPAAPLLTNITNQQEFVGVQDRPQRTSPKSHHYTTDASLYTSKIPMQYPVTNDSNAVLAKPGFYYKKAKTLCHNIIGASKYPELIKEMDCMITEVITTSEHLQGLEVDKSLTKEKQVSQAKNHLQQKQRALSDLFKTLSKIGLSYRKGIMESKQRDLASEFTIKPIDLPALMKHLSNSRIYDKLRILWEGTEVYYRKSQVRMEILDELLKSPAKDLGMQNVERCKGFAAYLSLLAHQQKTLLHTSISSFYELRHYQSIFTDQTDQTGLVLVKKVQKLRELLKNIIITMKQLKIVLNACPEENMMSSDVFEIPLLEPQNNLIKYKNDPMWNNTMDNINTVITLSEKNLSNLHKSKYTLPSGYNNFQRPKYIRINNSEQLFTNLKEISQQITDIQCVFGGIPMISSMNWIVDQIITITNDLKTDDESKVSVTEAKTAISSVINMALIIIQKVHLKYTEQDQEQPENETDNNIEEDHLTSKVIQSIFSDVTCLEMKRLLMLTRKATQLLFKSTFLEIDEYSQLMHIMLPFMEQIILFYQYFIMQQVSAYRTTCKINSILLNIFIDLASKGFCVPPDLAKEMDNEGESKTSSGMGLGDGEGEKDVSDKIESEDQLDDAQPAGQERKNEEDKDCKEEEKGIEMSEDFESKLQDVEKKPNEDDEDEQEDNDSDAEEQMGDTDKDANKLDKEVWGDDEEQEEPEQEEQEGKEEEKGDGGEKLGEELAAKENTSAQDDEQEQKDAKDEKEKTKKDINEMDEPEFDDEQTDPYHGNQPELPEPEPLDLPDDLQLDDGDGDDEQNEENPFDIDAMKDQITPPEETPGDETEDKPQEESKNDNADDSSDEEDDVKNEESIDKAEENKEEGDEEDNSTDDKSRKNADEPEKEQNDAEDNDQSVLDQTQSKEDDAQAMDVDDVAADDNVQANESKNQKANQPTEDISQEDRPDKEGVGQSQMEDSKTGHKGEANAEQDSNREKQDINDKKRNKPGQTDSDRTLGDSSEPAKKKMKTLKAENAEQEEDGDEGDKQDAEMYQHIKEAKEASEQVIDSITKEQAEQMEEKQVPNLDEEKDADKACESQKDLPEEDEQNAEEGDVEMTEVNKQKADELEKKSKGKEKFKQAQEDDKLEENKDIEIEGDVIDTMSVARNAETSHHTQFAGVGDTAAARMTVEDSNKLRIEVEEQLSVWNEPPSNTEAERAWEKISSLTSSLAQDLSEQLRLVLEPTQASRLRGDFRTGRRINMRKVIPYIASQFRKDKIWLRRTKPSKREYQIVLAIDDSSSMSDNHSKELAFESVALISKALVLLESGQLSVLRFGEGTEVLHKLTDTFTEKSGAKLLQQFQFDQKKTCVGKLVDFATEMLNTARASTQALLAKLLIVVSDGRGIFSEGESPVQQAVRRARLSNVFMIFVIIDNPENSSSILDIRKPVFKDGKILEIKSYMDSFPFPFYLILRDINTLPSVLSDALRQWFEIVSNVDR